MERSRWFDGWQGVVLVASTYIYFLIFAQFGFLMRLDAMGISGDSLKPVMGAMAAGGILASLLAGRLSSATAAGRLQLALLGCAAAAGWTLLPLSMIGASAVAFLIGVSLAALTVTLVANLPLWIGSSHPLLNVGLGTGLGYLVCNFPPLFTASPRNIALTAIGVCLCGLAASLRRGEETERVAAFSARGEPFVLILFWFTALVWLDSAAFFIIQNSPALKSGTWEGAAHLWRTGVVHLVVALFGVWLLARRGASSTLLLAFACLAGACLLLLDPWRAAPASMLYPAGVSLYSVALVAYPSLLMPSDIKERSRRAGWIYAVAGWIGSAMGIGMAQHLHRIPVWFVAVAAALFVLPLAWRYCRRYWREAASIGLVLAVAWGINKVSARHGTRSQTSADRVSAAERGRRVYLAEGCINCHSQYVRPNSPDVAMWGPAGNLDAIRQERPPLIGNRRQGPDLSEVGARRSPLWLRIHLIDPRAVSYGSIMPSYAYMFRNQQGDDLVAYLASLKSPESSQHIQEAVAEWRPNPDAIAEAGQLNGAMLFHEYCATCHDADGSARIGWGPDFKILPSNLSTAPLRNVPELTNQTEIRLRLAQVTKFGLPGTDMPGHEYLPDGQIEAIAQYVATLRKRQ